MKNKFDLGQRAYFYYPNISVSVLYSRGGLQCTPVDELKSKLAAISEGTVVGVGVDGSELFYTIELYDDFGLYKIPSGRITIKESGLYSTTEEARRVVIAGLASHVKTLGKFLGEEIQ